MVISHVEAAAPGLCVLTIEGDPLVTIGEIADRLNITREAVRLHINGMHSRGAYPAPAQIAGGRRLWRWSAVAAWYGRDTGWVPHEVAVACRAINGWLALRETVPALTPPLHDVAEALAAA